MSYYVILSRVGAGSFDGPGQFKEVAKKVAEEIRSSCPGLRIRHSFSTLGHYDVVDIVETDDPSQVEKAAMIIRSVGRSETEVLYATPWQEFLARL